MICDSHNSFVVQQTTVQYRQYGSKVQAHHGTIYAAVNCRTASVLVLDMVKYIESRPLLSTARHRHETTAAARTRAESSHGLSTRRRGLALLVVALIATVVVLVGFSAVHTPREGKTAGDNPNFLSTSMPLEADRPTQLEAAGYLRNGAQVSGDTKYALRVEPSGTLCTVLVLQHGTIFFAPSS